MREDFEPYSNVSPIKGKETNDFFEKYRGYVDVKEGILYRYVEPEDNKMKKKKDALLEELGKENLRVVSLAYVYAKNLHMYGEDVTKAICTATQNASMLEKAYQRGYYEAMNSMSADNEETAHWEKREYNDIPDKCSRCGHTYTEYIYGYEWEQTGELPKYCPNCGKRMEVENGN